MHTCTPPPLQAEVFVLLHTEDMLAAQEAALMGDLRAAERKQGVTVGGLVFACRYEWGK